MYETLKLTTFLVVKFQKDCLEILVKISLGK